MAALPRASEKYQVPPEASVVCFRLVSKGLTVGIIKCSRGLAGASWRRTLNKAKKAATPRARTCNATSSEALISMLFVSCWPRQKTAASSTCPSRQLFLELLQTFGASVQALFDSSGTEVQNTLPHAWRCLPHNTCASSSCSLQLVRGTLHSHSNMHRP